MLFKKRPPLVPEVGQAVELLMEDGSRRGGFVAVTPPLTAETTGQVVVKVATELEYRNAQWNRRGVVSMTWPLERLVVKLPWWRWQRWLTSGGAKIIA